MPIASHVKDKLRCLAAVDERERGFQLVRPGLEKFGHDQLDAYRKAIADQAEATAIMPADKLTEVGIDGGVCRGKLHLSHAAFSDLCHFSSVPVTFIKRLAAVDEATALEAFNSCIVNFFARTEKMLVVDVRADRVEGIVTKENYKPFSNKDALEYVLDARLNGKFTRGFLEGPAIRFSVVDDANIVEPKPGDVVRIGNTIENAISGDGSWSMYDYAEVLKCTNGMVLRDAEYVERYAHRGGDLHERVRMAVCKAVGKAAMFGPLLHAAANMTLNVEQINSVRAYLRSPAHGGGPMLEGNAVRQAVVEAHGEGKPEGDVSLWDFTNAVTYAAHHAASLQRRMELEALGFTMLRHFGSEFHLAAEPSAN